jgi:hypothetical protein
MRRPPAAPRSSRCVTRAAAAAASAICRLFAHALPCRAASYCVIVGRSFGAFVTHRTKSYMFFSVTPGVNCLVWKI